MESTENVKSALSLGNENDENVTSDKEDTVEEDNITQGGTGAASVTTESSDKSGKKEGFYKEKNAWVYYKNGKAVSSGTDIVQGVINNVAGWYYIKDGKADLTIESIEQNKNGWWYVKNGKVDFTKTSVERNSNGWWYVKDGKVDFGYNGFAKNKNGWWYIEKGKVTFKRNDVIQGTVNGENAWWNVKGSKVIFNETIEQNINGWWYIKDGKVDFTKTSVEHNSNGWWYVKNGKVNFRYNGFAKNKNGWWYIEKGKVTFKRNDVIKGTVNGENAWWNVKNSQVIFNTSVEHNVNGWWYIKDGKVDFSYTGTAANSNGWWYIKNGKVIFSQNGWFTVAGKKYYAVNGKVSTGIIKLGDNWYLLGDDGEAVTDTTKKIRSATYTTDKNAMITGVDYEVKTWINQLNYYGCWPMACGAAATLMALQANGYGEDLSGKAGWDSLMDSFRAIRGSSYGKRYGNGVMTATQMYQCVKKNTKLTNVPATPVTGSGVTLAKIQDALTHGQTVSALVALKSTTHWIAVTGWYKNGNTTMYRIADPFPADGKPSTNYATNVTTREGAFYSDKQSASDLWSILNASHLISAHNERHMLLIGNYK